MALERIQKILARAGVASRRAAEALILDGRVRVDGRVVTELGTKADPRRARIEVDGKRIVAEPLVYIVLHKPQNVVCTLRDPEGRPTVAELVREVDARVVPVGRLDFATSGVLLLTNDGDFAATLTHPRHETEKVYVAKVNGAVGEDALAAWGQSITIDGRATRPAKVRALRTERGKTWLEIMLKEGRNRQVRRLGEATGFLVMRLVRSSFAGITVEGLRPGRWRHLTRDELLRLKRAHGVPKKIPAPPATDASPRQRGASASKPTAGRGARLTRPRSTGMGAKGSRSRSR